MKHTNHVDVPLVFFSLAFFIILFGMFSKISFQKKSFIQENRRQTIAPVPTQGKKALQLDYNKPLICDHQSKDASISAQLSGNNVAATIIKNKIMQSYIVSGDCMYSWVADQKIGKKQCGVGQYIGMGRKLLSSGLATPQSLADTIKEMGKGSFIDITGVLETCKNVKMVKGEVFMLPKSVVFK